MALVSGGIVVADGVTDHAPLDVRLKSAVKQSLDDYEQVTIEGLSIEVEFGIVTLEGKVATPAEKHLAARRVRNIVGVRGVVNAIDVDERLKLVQ
jgi:osmotically-inducible protein OsmY